MRIKTSLFSLLLLVLLFIVLSLFINVIKDSAPVYSQSYTTCKANAASAAIVADTTVHAAATGSKLLCGFSVTETAATADVATIIPRVGVVSGGNCTGNPVHVQVELNPNESVFYPFPNPVDISAGFCIDRTAGTVSVATHTRP